MHVCMRMRNLNVYRKNIRVTNFRTESAVRKYFYTEKIANYGILYLSGLFLHITITGRSNQQVIVRCSITKLACVDLTAINLLAGLGFPHMKKTKSYKVNHFTGLHRHTHHLPSLFMPSLMHACVFTSLLHIITLIG